MAGIDFFLISAETEPALAPRKCTVTDRLSVAGRDDLAVVQIVPPIEQGIYGRPFAKTAELVLAARWEGTTLFPPSEWPLAVFICQLKKPETKKRGAAVTEDIEILSWGLILPSLREAEKWLETGNDRRRV